jgi:hypothetical protein
MTFNSTYIEFDESIAELEDRIDEIEEQISELDEGNPLLSELSSQHTEMRLQRKGAVWARDQAAAGDDFPQWDEDVDGITLGAVRASAFSQIEHEAGERDGEGTDLLLIADGTVDAPYVDDSMSDSERAAAVGQLHPYYRKWAAARIDELLDPEGNVTGSDDSPEAT